MRLSFLLILWAIVFTGFSVFSEGPLKLTVITHSDEKGEVMVALFNQEKGFPYEGAKAIRLAKGNAVNGTCQLVIDQLPPGRYAVSVFQDRNGDKKFNTNFLGIPQEGYGVSNNALSSFRAPTFQEAAFQHKGTTELEIRLSY